MERAIIQVFFHKQENMMCLNVCLISGLCLSINGIFAFLQFIYRRFGNLCPETSVTNRRTKIWPQCTKRVSPDYPGESWYMLHFSVSFQMNIAVFWNVTTCWLVICYQLQKEFSASIFRVKISNIALEQVILLRLNVVALGSSSNFTV
jgi:hypothetical protein